MRTAVIDQKVCFNDLDSRYRRPLFAFFRRRRFDQAETEDLTQEVFMKLLTIKNECNIENYDAFIFTVASNVAKDAYRRSHSYRRVFEGGFNDDESGYENDLNVVNQGDFCSSNPEKILVQEQHLSALNAGVLKLDERARKIFLLYKIHNMKQKEIASMLDISLSTVEKQLVKTMVYLAQETFR